MDTDTVLLGIDQDKTHFVVLARNATRIQRAFRRSRLRSVSKVRLHRKNLGQRLRFEFHLFHGFFRLFNTLVLFVLLLSALWTSNSFTAKGNIRSVLDSAFDFEKLEQIHTMPDLVEACKDIASGSKQFFPLSSSIFEQSQPTVQLLKNFTFFSAPMPLMVGNQITVDVNTFSFSMWIDLGTTVRNGGFFIHKRTSGTYPATCWSFQAEQHSISLVYGGHDFNDNSPTMKNWGSSSSGEVKVTLSFNHTGEEDDNFSEPHLIVVVVSRTEMTYYHRAVLMGSVALPRPLTECDSPQGIFLGDQGISLGQVVYYPKALSISDVLEIQVQGAKLIDIATASDPVVVSNTGESTSDVAEETLKVSETILREDDLRLYSVLSFVDNNVRGQSVSNCQCEEENDSQQESPLLSSLSNIEALPQGSLPLAHPDAILDPVTGREYFSLVGEPAFLSRPEEGEVGRYFNRSTFPIFSGQSVTFTLWYRSAAPDQQALGAQDGGMFLLAQQPSTNTSKLCWSFYMGNVEIGSYSNFGNQMSMLKKNFLQPNKYPSWLAWRHLTWQLNVEENVLRYYLDGSLAHENTIPFNSSYIQCLRESAVVSLGHRFNSRSNSGGEAYVADLRMYVGAPLSPDSIYNLAFTNTTVDVECIRDSPEMNNDHWRDLYGNDCTWYGKQVSVNANICLYPGAATNCPTTCSRVQQCFENMETVPQYILWDKVRVIESTGPQGTLCLSDDLSRRDVLEQCSQSAGFNSENIFYRAEYDAQLQAGGKRINLTDCAELEASIDESCSFSSEMVRNFTRDVKENGGDYTIYFWLKSLGELSLDDLGMYLPQVGFLAQLHPPVSRLTLSAEHQGPQSSSLNWNFFSQCDKEVQEITYTDVEVLQQGDWTRFSVARSNVTKWANQGSVNARVQTESTKMWSQCIDEDIPFLSALEINYATLMSPIHLIPRVFTPAKLQTLYYQQEPEMRKRIGPKSSKAFTPGEADLTHKQPFTKLTAMVAPPMIFQRRSKKDVNCSFDFSTFFINSKHKTALEYVCADPNFCTLDVIENPNSVYACTSDPEKIEPFFGLNVTDFQGRRGYADLLNSITDFQFVERDGSLYNTKDFFDDLVSSVEVVLVFYSPTYGITTVFQFSAEMSSPRYLESSVTVSHFQIVKGDQMTRCEMLFGGVVFFTVILVFRVSANLAFSMSRRYKGLARIKTVYEIGNMIVDCGVAVLISFYLGYQLPELMSSEEDTVQSVGLISRILWDSDVISTQEKSALFLRETEIIMNKTVKVAQVELIATVSLFALMLRLITATNIHPRLALLTGTISRCVDDMWHTMLLVFMVMYSFGAIATWRFGAQYEEFRDLLSSLQTQFQMLLGEIPDLWTDSNLLKFYTVTYLVIMFLLVLNFLLAIIVDAYMKLRLENDINEIEMEFLHDVILSVTSFVKRYWYGWPHPVMLDARLESMWAKLSVDAHDLAGASYRSKQKGGHVKLRDFERHNPDHIRQVVFRNEKAVTTFLNHYKHLDCLKPHVLPPPEYLQTVQEIEKRTAWLMGKNPPKFQDHLCYISKGWKAKAADPTAIPAVSVTETSKGVKLKPSPLPDDDLDFSDFLEIKHPNSPIARINQIKDDNKTIEKTARKQINWANRL